MSSQPQSQQPPSPDSTPWLGHQLRTSRDRASVSCDLCAKRLRGRFDFLSVEYWRCAACGYSAHKACLQRCCSSAGATLQPSQICPPQSCPVQMAQAGQLTLNWTTAHPDPVVTDLHAWVANCADCGSQVAGCEGIRFCSYFGRAYCSRCHWNDTAVVPASLLVTCLARPQPVSRSALGIIRALEADSYVRLDSHEGLAFLHEYLHRNFNASGGGQITASLHDIVTCRQALVDKLADTRDCAHLRASLSLKLPAISRRHLLPQTAYQFNLRELVLIANGDADQLMLQLSEMLKAVVAHSAACLDCTPRVCPGCLDVRRKVHRFGANSVFCSGCGSVYHGSCRQLASHRHCRVCLCQEEVRRMNTAAIHHQQLSGSRDAQLLSIYEAGRSCREQVALLQRLLSLAPSCELQQQHRLQQQQQQQQQMRASDIPTAGGGVCANAADSRVGDSGEESPEESTGGGKNKKAGAGVPERSRTK